MDDLDRGMFDDEEAGVPTPPDDADEPLKHVRMTYQHPAPTSILSDPATGEPLHMYPPYKTSAFISTDISCPTLGVTSW